MGDGPNPSSDPSADLSLNQSVKPNPTIQETSVADVSTGGGLDVGGGVSDDDNDDDGEQRPSIFESFSRSMEGEKVSDKDKDVRRTRASTAEGGRRSDRPKKRVVDMWAMLDPHEEVGPTKAFKKGL